MDFILLREFFRLIVDRGTPRSLKEFSLLNMTLRDLLVSEVEQVVLLASQEVPTARESILEMGMIEPESLPFCAALLSNSAE
jgi:hypothetical protein